VDSRERKEKNSLIGSFVMCGIGVEKTRNARRVLVKSLKGIIQFEDLCMVVLLLRRFLDNYG
jgi:hypothetical protein